MDMGIAEIEQLKVRGLSGELLAAALDRMRRGEVSISPGYDGEYGVIRVFPPGAAAGPGGGNLFDNEDIPQKNPGPERGKAPAIPAAVHPAPDRAQAPAPLSPRADGIPAYGGFDQTQREIINHQGNRTMVIAGPGTGKTAVLAARIAKLINDGAAPDSILALSFTVKAAAELRRRVEGLLDRERQPGAVTAATFHSFCCSLLREQAAEAGIAPDFAIIGEARRDELLRELCGSGGGKKAPTAGKLGNYIEGRKRFLLLPGGSLAPGGKQSGIGADFFASLGMAPPEPLAEMEELYCQYRGRLRESGLLDYEDLVSGAARLLCAKTAVLTEYRRRFRHIFVDEYQDINLSQYILLRLLADGGNGNAAAEGGPSLWVIGDPNQAIYGFRGSDKRFIDRFTLDYPEARTFALARSFRCAEAVINAAGRLTGSELRGEARPVELRRFAYATGRAEAEGVARIISRLIGGATFFAMDSGDADPDSRAMIPGNWFPAGAAAPGDCAVLIRAAPLAGPVVKALQDHGIPFELSGEQCWWETEPFNSFLARVRHSAAPEDEFQTEKENPAMRRLFDLAALFGSVPSLLDALALSGPGAFPGFNSEGVRVMTMHASKGLEFDHVFVIGLEEGMVPFTLYHEDGADSAARIAEERRLLYVAMTRARSGLYLSWSRSRNFRGRILNGSPSPFLGELDKLIPLAEDSRPRRTDDQLRLF
jgi:superfamily I DNA/RNA helicase